MQYYMFELNDKSKEPCPRATPYGLYKYNRLPMELKCAPDITQECMEQILGTFRITLKSILMILGVSPKIGNPTLNC